MIITGKRILRAVSALLCLAIFAGFAALRLPLTANAEAPIRAVLGKATQTSTGALIQAYAAVEKGVSTEVGFYRATLLDVYGFFSYEGGNNANVKSDPSERHLTGTDGDCYVTKSLDRSAQPYQAFEADVRGVSGDVIVGYEGRLHEEDTSGAMTLQIWDPAASKYEKFDESGAVSNGAISLTATVDAQAYAENGRLRYRVVLPARASYKWIFTRYATVGRIDEDAPYGAPRKRTNPGNASCVYKGEVTDDMCFCVKMQTETQTSYSIVYPFGSDNTAQKLLAHFNVNFNGDAGTTRNMSWMSATDLGTPEVQVAPYGAMRPDFTNAATYSGTTYKLSIKTAEKPYCYAVTVDGLEPGREYWYRYGNGDVWSSPCYLRTDDGDAHFAFAMGGDPQSYTESEDEAETESVFGQYRQVGYSWNEAVRSAGAEFFCNLGDESENGNYESCWDWYYDTNQAMFRSYTLAPTMGNHDNRGWEMWTYNHFISEPGRSDRGSYYSFDYGNAHFIVLNGNMNEWNNRKAERDKEYEWLRSDLEAHKDADFKIVVQHQGMYSYPGHTNDIETVELREMLVPLIDEYGVDLMLQGHDHIWLRTQSMKGGVSVSAQNTNTIIDGGVEYFIDPQGTTYTNGGSLSGSKYNGADPAYAASFIKIACASQPERPTYSTIRIDGGKLVLKGWASLANGSQARIGSLSHYGSEGDEYAVVKTCYYDKINARINALPETATLADKDEVLALKEICDAESETFLAAFVPDYAKLAAAVEEIGRLTPAFVRGDLDGDGEVTVADALAALRVAVRLAEETPEAVEIADSDGDGAITVSDALAILRVAAKLKESL